MPYKWIYYVEENRWRLANASATVTFPSSEHRYYSLVSSTYFRVLLKNGCWVSL